MACQHCSRIRQNSVIPGSVRVLANSATAGWVMLHEPSALAASPAPPTAVRYGVLFCMCTLALLLYVDRVCIGQAADAILRDLHLTKTHLSWANIAFTLAYCVF